MEDPDFLSNVKALADNGTLAELLRRIEEDAASDWKVATTAEAREACHATIRAINALKDKITSLKTDEAVRMFNNRRREFSGSAAAFNRSL
jgi:hypothetical protein